MAKDVARMSADQVVEALKNYRSVISREKFQNANGITELRILLASLIAMARVEERIGSTVW